jgi:hypothetical protein
MTVAVGPPRLMSAKNGRVRGTGANLFEKTHDVSGQRENPLLQEHG